jgi:hypothetical protein
MYIGAHARNLIKSHFPVSSISQPVSSRMAVVVGTGSPDLKVGGRGEIETVYGRGEGVVKCRF